MTVPVGATSRPEDRYVSESSYMDEEDRGYGWVAFAGTLLLMLGLLLSGLWSVNEI